MKKSPSVYLRLIFLLGDLSLINLVLLFAYRGPVASSTEELISVLTIANSLWVFLALVLNPYKFSRVSRFIKILRIHFTFIVVYFLSFASVSFLTGVEIAGRELGLIVLLSVSLLFVWRLFYFYANRVFVNKKLNFRNVIVVGYGDLAIEMRKFFRLHPEYGY